MALILDLSSVRAKLARAQEHAQTVKSEIAAYMGRSPYAIVKHANIEQTRYSIILRVNEPAPLLRWSLIVADCLNNLRSALDHLIYTIALLESSPNPPAYEGKLAFPIADCREKFDEAVSQRKLGDLSLEIREVISDMQPYKRPHEMLPPLLSILRGFSNSDKHKLLRLAFGAVREGHVGFIGDAPQDGRIWQQVAHSGEIKDGTEIFAMVCDRPSPNMNFDRTEFQIIIAMLHGKRSPSDPEGTDRTEVPALLNLLMTEVREIIHGVDQRISRIHEIRKKSALMQNDS
jgi:hypothetical protein